MQLVINGQKKIVEGSQTVTLKELLLQLGYETDSVAVAHAGTFVSRSKYAEQQIQDGEELEILVPMQGG